VLLVSEAERAALARRAPGADLRVVPNGVDLGELDPARFPAAPDPGVLVFCGAMDYIANVDAVVWFHDEVLPLVRREFPDVRFRIVGAEPARAVRRLARTPGVEVTGAVPDVRPAIASAGVSVAPLRLGRGVPNKVLEALALSLPVVTTPNGAAGLDLAAFPGADVADGREAFARAVVRRMRDAADGKARFPEHRALLAERYDWEKSMAAIREAVAPGGGPP
ncbi:MAG: glycosyltransferase, partial [Planctomycetota bacterium]